MKSDQKASFHREICEKMDADRGGCRLAILELFSGFSELLRIARVLTDMSGSFIGIFIDSQGFQNQK